MQKTFINKLPVLLTSRYYVLGMFLLLTLSVYANSFPASFIQDDIHIVQRNPLVAEIDLVKIFTSDYWLGLEQSGLYRPLTILSLAVNRLVLGDSPSAYHLINVLLHAVTGILLWLTLIRWEMSTTGALLAACLFLVHPIHSEVINEVVGRSELLVAMLVLLALFVARSDTLASRSMTLLCFAGALFAKEHAIVFLALLPLFDAYLAGSITIFRKRWGLYASMVGVTLLWYLLRSYVITAVGVESVYSPTAVPLAYVSVESRFVTALLYQWVYLGKLLLPLKLQAVYSQADLPLIIDSVFSLEGLGVLLSTAMATILVAVGWYKRQPLALFVALYAVSFMPTANLFIPIGVTFAERLSYFPSLWFCAGIGVVVSCNENRELFRRLALTGFCFYVLILSIILIQRNRDFASELRLWSREVQLNPADYLGLLSYAEVLTSNHRNLEAEQAYQRLLAMRPDFQGALRSYSDFLRKQKKFSEALIPAHRVLEISMRQGEVAGVAYDLTSLAQLYIELNQFEQSLELLRRTSANQVQESDYYYALLGRAQEGVGDYAGAVESYAQLQSLQGDLDLPLHYGLSLMRVGRLDDARKKLEYATRVKPQGETWNMLGTIYAQLGQLEEAELSFSQAVELSPEKGHYRDNLQRVKQMRASQ